MRLEPRQQVRDTVAMIAGMPPVPDPQTYCFCSLTGPFDPSLRDQACASFREEEGLSLILPQSVAQAHGLSTDQPMRRITLGVYSALDGVGLTAAVATALARNGISCNMVAAFHHDHVFVPAGDAARALAVLQGLSEKTKSDSQEG